MSGKNLGFTLGQGLATALIPWGVVFVIHGVLLFLVSLYFWAVPLIFDLVNRGAYKVEGQYYLASQAIPVSMLAAFMLCLGLATILVAGERVTNKAVRIRRWIGVAAFVVAVVTSASLAYSSVFEWIRFAILNRGNGEAVTQMIFDMHRPWFIVDNVVVNVALLASVGSGIATLWHLWISLFGFAAKRFASGATQILGGDN